MSIPTPSESKGWNRKHRKGMWDRSTVYWIVISETYCGVLHYGKFIGENGRGGKRSLDAQISIEVPAIISRETWELAQERREYNRKIAKRRTKREYLLRGLIKCGCGFRMIGTKGRYYCNGRIRKYSCKEPLVPGQVIEPLVWAYVMELITSPGRFEERLRLAQAKELENTKPRRKEAEHILALIQQTENEADDVARALTRAQGLISSRLEQQAIEVDRRYKALTQRQIELQESLGFEMTDNMIENLMEFRKIVADGLANPTFEDKRRWLEILQIEVVVMNKQAVITCRLPVDAFIVDLEGSNDPNIGKSLLPFELSTSRNLKIVHHVKS
jgi:site-specific DNA recombinase